jgi:hypothetical protein
MVRLFCQQSPTGETYRCHRTCCTRRPTACTCSGGSRGSRRTGSRRCRGSLRASWVLTGPRPHVLRSRGCRGSSTTSTARHPPWPSTTHCRDGRSDRLSSLGQPIGLDRRPPWSFPSTTGAGRQTFENGHADISPQFRLRLPAVTETPRRSAPAAALSGGSRWATKRPSRCCWSGIPHVRLRGQNAIYGGRCREPVSMVGSLWVPCSPAGTAQGEGRRNLRECHARRSARCHSGIPMWSP